MRKALTVGAMLGTMLTTVGTVRAATLQVGPGKTYSKPCDAIAAAQTNDVIEVAPGTYTDTCYIRVQGLTVRGVGGQPKIDLTGGAPAGQKGIYVIGADGITIENLELMGAEIPVVPGENAAALRIEASGLTVRGCYIHDNQDGILGDPLQPGGTLTVEGTEFKNNGMGSGCVDPGNGCTHNLYLGANFQKVTFQYNWSHHLATDTPDKGHLLKSRAQETYVLYNRITAEGDTDSYEIDIPQGGLAVVVGNMVEKSTTSGNSSMLAYGEETFKNADHRIFVANNTFVNNLGKGTFLNVVSGGTLVAHNNLFVGAGTPSSTGALSADNLSGVNPLLVDAANYDYHLTAGSPAIDKGVDPGSADTFSLTPTQEYVHPLLHAARKADGKLDVGAFEFGTDTTDAGGSGGTTGAGGSGGTTGAGGSTGSGGAAGAGGAAGVGGAAGAGGRGAAGSAATGGGPASGGPDAASTDSTATPSGDSGGCGCRLARPAHDSLAWALVASGLAAIGVRRRRRSSSAP
jgi:MYXO-CTERM domain-containing protein